MLTNISLFLAHFVSTFWVKDREDFSKGDILFDEDDIFMTETIFNSRGPRSLYRGLEEAPEIEFLDENYEDF